MSRHIDTLWLLDYSANSSREIPLQRRPQPDVYSCTEVVHVDIVAVVPHHDPPHTVPGESGQRPCVCDIPSPLRDTERDEVSNNRVQ